VLNPKFLYLTLDLGSFFFPFLFSFYSKADFSRQWKFVLPGILITACIFIVWDELFVRAGIWGFNEKYTTGIFLNSLPLEELLFFLCIPYACYFTYFAMKFLIRSHWLDCYEKQITTALALVMICLSLIFMSKLYTFTTFFLLGLLLGYRLWQGMTKDISKFYLSYLVLLIPFFIVNGILTGSGIEQPVVWYNNAETIGIRLSTIPIEDFFYAMLMILLSITIAEKLESVSKKKDSPVKAIHD